MSRLSITIVVLAALLVLPGGATAQGTQPPDHAGVDEYVESVPGPTGNRPSRDIGRGRGRDGGSGGLSSGTVSALEALGSDGQAVAGFTAATAPRESEASSKRRGSADGAGLAGGGPGVRAIGGAAVGASGEGGMGIFLPLILAAALLGAVAAAVARRRRRAGQPE